MLDPTRVTLFIGKTGMNGYDFREKILMERFGIQINKTSINSVLLIFTIGVTWSSVHYLLDALRRVAADLDRSARHGQQGRPRAAAPACRGDHRGPAAHCPTSASSTPHSDPTAPVRSATCARRSTPDTRNPTASTCCSARRDDGSPRASTLVSTTFVVPYPPGFPVLVPGQVVSKEILYFLAQLDVKEIHGYNPDLGLSVFTEAAIARLTATHGKADAHAPPGTQASITLTD